MRKMKLICLAALSAIVLALFGCAGGNLQESQRIYYLQDNMGRSMKTASLNQTLNPQAGLTAEPVLGFAGRAASLSLDKYIESFRKEVAPATMISPVFSVDVGGN